MRAKAMECIERIHKAYPREEEKNEKLRNLYLSANFTPRYAEAKPAPAPRTITSVFQSDMKSTRLIIFPASVR